MLKRNENQGCGAITDERAIVDGERFGNGPARERLFEGDDFTHVGQRILCAVRMILDRDSGQLFTRGAVLVHMPLSDHGEQGGEGGAGAAFARHVARTSKNLRNTRGGLGGHLFHAGYDDDIINAGRHTLPRMEECRPAGSAGVFNACARNGFEPAAVPT